MERPRSCHAAAASVAPAGADAAVDGTVALPAERRVAMAVLAVCSGLGGQSRQLSCRGHRPLAAARAVRRLSPPSTPCRCGALRNCWTCLFRSGAAGMHGRWRTALPPARCCRCRSSGAVRIWRCGRSHSACRRLTARRSGPSCRAPCPTCAKALDRNGPVTEARSQSQRAGARRRPVLSCLSPIKIIAAKLVQAGVLDHQCIGTGPDHHVAPDLACGAAHVAPAVEAGIG